MDCRPQAREIDVLYDIAQELLNSDRELEPILNAVLAQLARHLGMERGMITLIDRKRSEIRVEAAHGLSPAQRQRGRYRPGEGIIGQVIRRGEPALVPSIGDEPLFLDRTRSREDLDWSRIAFVCVPIASRKEIIGTISADRIAGQGISLEEDFRLLTVIARVIGDAVRNWRDHREEVDSLRREKERIEELQAGEFRPEGMIGNSRQIRETSALIRQVAPFDTTVLLRGESGTGKEVAARAIHRLSNRSKGPFVAINCGSLPENLVSELFGHVRGAFTGAEADRRGRFEMASGGTIFLDEVGELLPAIQVKLLRVLQEGEIERLGEEKPRRIDVRVIAATNANLEKAIEEGRFRGDLYYRLNVFPIHLAPLRDRKTDITVLADHFLELSARKLKKGVVRISTPAIELMTAYHWPGNVRELENCVARAVLLTDDGVIRSHHLPPTLQTGNSSGTTKAGSLKSMMMAFEREILIEAMKNASWNQRRAARALATTPRILAYRLRRHGLTPERDARGPDALGVGATEE
jgi:Nif-specific regulatory protein